MVASVARELDLQERVQALASEQLLPLALLPVRPPMEQLVRELQVPEQVLPSPEPVRLDHQAKEPTVQETALKACAMALTARATDLPQPQLIHEFGSMHRRHLQERADQRTAAPQRLAVPLDVLARAFRQALDC